MIIRLNPEYRPMVWGSENWVVSGYPSRESLVCEGPLKGKTLNEVYGSEFPLLVKFIDARSDLSIQVHPDDALAFKRGIGRGKTEMWYVMRDGGSLISGFREPVSPSRYEQLVAENRLVDVLQRHEEKKGDVFFLPAGRIHAICGGSLLCEVQQTSDTTYRIFDYNRPGLDGKPRELHVEQAKEAINFEDEGPYTTDYERLKNSESVVVRDPHFTASVFDLDRPVKVSMHGRGRFLAVMCVEGSGSVNGHAINEGEALLALDEEAPVELAPSTGGTVKFLTANE